MMFASVSILGFIIIFFVLAFGMGQVAWIYLDSKERGDKLGALWTILAIFPIFMPYILPLPLIIYLIVTRAFSDKCPNCSGKVNSSFVNCPHCNYKLKNTCNKCNKAVDKNWSYCPYCSEGLNKREDNHGDH